MGYRSGAEGFNQAINAIAGFFEDRAGRLREEQQQRYNTALTTKDQLNTQITQIQTALSSPDLDEQTRQFLQSQLSEMQNLTSVTLDGFNPNEVAAWNEQASSLLGGTFEAPGVEGEVSLEGALSQAQRTIVDIGREREAAQAQIGILAPILQQGDVPEETKQRLVDNFLSSGASQYLEESQLGSLAALGGYSDPNALKLREQQIISGELSIEAARQNIEITDWNFANAQTDRAYETTDELRKNVASAVEAGDVVSLRMWRSALSNPQANPVLAERMEAANISMEDMDGYIEQAQRREEIQIGQEETRLQLMNEQLAGRAFANAQAIQNAPLENALLSERLTGAQLANEGTRFANEQAVQNAPLQNALLQYRVDAAATDAQFGLIDTATRTYQTVEQFDADSDRLAALGATPAEIEAMRTAVSVQENLINKDDSRAELQAFSKIAPADMENTDGWRSSFVRLAQDAGFSEDEAITMADGYLAAYQTEDKQNSLRTQELELKANLAQMDYDNAIAAGEEPPDATEVRLQLNQQMETLRTQQLDNGCLPESSLSAILGRQLSAAENESYAATMADSNPQTCERLRRDFNNIQDAEYALLLQGPQAALGVRDRGDAEFEVSGGDPVNSEGEPLTFVPEGGAASYTDMTVTQFKLDGTSEDVVVPGSTVTQVAQMYDPSKPLEEQTELENYLNQQFGNNINIGAKVLTQIMQLRGVAEE